MADSTAILGRLRAACVCRPGVMVWPHRLLREAIECIEELECELVDAEVEIVHWRTENANLAARYTLARRTLADYRKGRLVRRTDIDPTKIQDDASVSR